MSLQDDTIICVFWGKVTVTVFTKFDGSSSCVGFGMVFCKLDSIL